MGLCLEFVKASFKHYSNLRMSNSYLNYLKRLVTKLTKMACVPSEDSDQPGHPPSLIRVFAVPMKKHWVLSYP